MEQITFNPNNEPYYSEDFIKGFKCGAERQFEADKSDDLIKRSDVYKAVDDWLEGKVPNLNIKDIPSADERSRR